MDGQDVAADLLRDFLPQLAQPLAHGLMVNVGAVERAAEPRTLGRATGHEPECTYLGTDVKGCRGPDPSPQCLPDQLSRRKYVRIPERESRSACFAL